MRNHISTLLKGVAMGAADVVPGVSGGTVAFITGIYETLIESLKSFDHHAAKELFSGQFKKFWSRVNGPFLLSLFIGIAISILTLARVMEHLLINYPIATWSLFFGLIVASTIMIRGKVTNWRVAESLFFIIGLAIAVWLALTTPAESSEALWFIFISGAIAITAMILPGISGSFILLLMGKYAFMMNALNTFNLPVIFTFIGGAVVGLLLFSHFLSWLLKNYHNGTIALLTGFMAGSLVKVWPWKRLSSLYEGIDWPTTPGHYSDLTGGSSYLFVALLLATIGFLLPIILEKSAKIGQD